MPLFIQVRLDSDWENLLHVFLPLEEKEAVKSMFDIKSVPFCIVLDKVCPQGFLINLCWSLHFFKSMDRMVTYWRRAIRIQLITLN